MYNEQTTGIEITSEFHTLNDQLPNLQPSNLILIASRPSMGKTTFAMNIAQHVSLIKKVAFFSLEMSKEQFLNRLASFIPTADTHNFQNLEANIIINDTPGLSIPEFQSLCNKYKFEHNIELIIIDYLQLMSFSSDRQCISRTQDMCEICKFLKQTAAKLHVPVIVLSSLPRRTDANFDHRSLLSDFQEVGYLENSIKKYFDIVIFLHRDEYYNPNSKAKNITEVIIAKHKNEIPRTVYLDSSPSSSKI